MSEEKVETTIWCEMTVTQYSAMLFALGYATGAAMERGEKELAAEFLSAGNNLRKNTGKVRKP